eukprot:4074051-Amphidinium_carterae.1
MVQSKPQPNCDDCIMNASVRLSVPTHRTMPHHMQHASEHLHAQRPFRTNLHWPGTQRPPKTFFPR